MGCRIDILLGHYRIMELHVHDLHLRDPTRPIIEHTVLLSSGPASKALVLLVFFGYDLLR